MNSTIQQMINDFIDDKSDALVIANPSDKLRHILSIFGFINDSGKLVLTRENAIKAKGIIDKLQKK